MVVCVVVVGVVEPVVDVDVVLPVVVVVVGGRVLLLQQTHRTSMVAFVSMMHHTGWKASLVHSSTPDEVYIYF